MPAIFTALCADAPQQCLSVTHFRFLRIVAVAGKCYFRAWRCSFKRIDTAIEIMVIGQRYW